MTPQGSPGERIAPNMYASRHHPAGRAGGDCAINRRTPPHLRRYPAMARREVPYRPCRRTTCPSSNRLQGGPPLTPMCWRGTAACSGKKPNQWSTRGVPLSAHSHISPGSSTNRMAYPMTNTKLASSAVLFSGLLMSHCDLMIGIGLTISSRSDFDTRPPRRTRARRHWARRSGPLTVRTVLGDLSKREMLSEELAKGGPKKWPLRPAPLT
jgi:hypothetical protein